MSAFLLTLLLGANAQEGPAESRLRFFSDSIDLWKTGRGAEPLPQAAPPSASRNGGSPPPAVAGFLENPTPETLEAYVAWKRARLQNLAKALALLRAWHREHQPQPPAGVDPSPPAAPERKDGSAHRRPVLPFPFSSPKSSDVTVLYFHQKG